MKMMVTALGILMIAMTTVNAEETNSAKEPAVADVCNDGLLDVYPKEILLEVFVNNGMDVTKVEAIKRALDDQVANEDEAADEGEVAIEHEPAVDDDDMSDEKLMEGFASVLKANGISDMKLIGKMFTEIQEKHYELLKRCIPE